MTDQVEDDRLVHSRSEMPWYRTGESDWEAAQEAYRRTQPDCGDPEDFLEPEAEPAPGQGESESA